MVYMGDFKPQKAQSPNLTAFHVYLLLVLLQKYWNTGILWPLRPKRVRNYLYDAWLFDILP